MKKYFLYCLLATLIILTAGSVCLLTYLPKIVKNYSAEYLEKYNIGFKAGLISISFPPAVILNKASAWQNDSNFKADKVVLRFNLIKLIKTRNISYSFSEVLLVNPELNIGAISALPFGANSGNTSFGEMLLDWKNAKINILKNGIAINSKLGRLILSKTIDSFETDISASGYGNARIKLVSNKRNQRWNLKVDTNNLTAASGKTSVLLEGAFPVKEHIHGKLKIVSNYGSNMRLEGRGAFKLSGLGNSPSIYSRINLLIFNSGKNILNGNTEIVFSSGIFNIVGFQMAGDSQEISASGFISKENIKVKASFTNILAESLFPSAKGLINADVIASGNLSNPSINASLLGKNLELGPIKSNFVKFDVSYKDKNYKLNGTADLNGPQYNLALNARQSAFNNKKRFSGKMFITGSKKINAGFQISDDQIQLSNCLFFDDLTGKENAAFFFSAGTKENVFNDYKMSVSLTNYPLGKNKMSGNIAFSGKANTYSKIVSGEMNGTNLMISDYLLGQIQAKFVFENDVVSITNIKAMNSISGDINYFTDTGILKGYANLNDFNILNLRIKDLSGKLSGNMRIFGTLTKPQLGFDFKSTNLSYKKIDANLKGRGSLTGDTFKSHGELQILSQEKGRFTININNLSNSPELTSNVAFSNMNITTLNVLTEKLFSFKLPLEGNVKPSFIVIGNLSKLTTTLNIQSDSLLYSGNILPEKWKSLDLSIEMNSSFNSITVNKLDIESADQRISISKGSKMDFSKPGDWGFDCNMELKNYIFGPVTMFGKLGLSGSIKNSKEKLIVASTISTQDLWVNQQNLKDTNMKIQFTSEDNRKIIELIPQKNEKFVTSGKIDISNPKETTFTNFIVAPKSNIKGSYLFKLNGTYSQNNSNLTIEGNNINLDFITGLLDQQMPLSGSTDFTVILKGEIKKPYIAGTINISAGDFYSIPFTNANLQLNYEDNVLELTNARLVRIDNNSKEQLIVSGKGRIPLAFTETVKNSPGDNNINLSFQIEKGDLAILESISDNIKSARGKIEAKLQVSGKADQPIYGGYLIVSNAQIESKSYFNKLENFNLGVAFTDNKLEIKECSGKIGDGTVKLDGYLLLGELFSINEYNLSLNTTGKKGIKIFVPELPIPTNIVFKTMGLEGVIKNYSFADVKTSLQFTGKSESPKLNGYIQLDNAHFCYPPPPNVSGNSFFSTSFKNVVWDVELRPGENTWYENSMMSALLTGKIRLNGNLPGLIVNGSIESQNGNLNYLNKIYELKYALFEVINSECFLQVRAETAGIFTSGAEPTSTGKETGTVEMIIPRSPIGQIAPKFSSAEHPDMSSEKLVQATYGLTDNITPTERNLLLRKQLIRLFDGSLASPLAKRLLQQSGIVDTINVTTVPSAQDETINNTNPSIVDIMSGTRYALQKYITGDLLLGYAITLQEAQQRLNLRHEFELDYRWKGNIFIRGIYGYEPTKSSLIRDGDYQIRIEPQWRFGWPKETEKKNEKK
ncbi:MAG: hypothetical protein KKG87_03360 [Elusimicrobia bacterium]|nr:hypothetical protein [Elusimicrobiota bacterium]